MAFIAFIYGDLFTQLAAGFLAHDINGGPPRHRIQPGGENGVGLELSGLPREVGKGGLGDFLGQLRRADLPERGGIDEVHMALHERGEGGLRVVVGELPEQFVVGIAHSHEAYRRRSAESDKKS